MTKKKKTTKKVSKMTMEPEMMEEAKNIKLMKPANSSFIQMIKNRQKGK